MDYSLNEEVIEHIFNKVKNSILPSQENNYKSNFLQSKALLYFAVLLLILKIATVLAPINFPYNIFFADITKSSLENFANQTRQSLGLKPLIENEKLNQAAQLKAENMVQEQYFNHVSPSGVTPWSWFLKAGYNYKYAGENLAVGFFDSQEVYNAWLDSKSHKANIINPNYTEVGTAILNGFGPNNATIVVQEFGTQSQASQTEIENGNSKPSQPQSEIQTTEENGTNNAETTAPITKNKVLSQETESQSFLGSPVGNASDNLTSRLFNFALYSYDNFLQNIIYGVSLIIIGILLALIFFNSEVNFKKELVFRAVFIIVLLSAATLLNKEVIISLIPHEIII